MLVIGYDDLKITNTNTGTSTKGALLVRNSWGAGWGDDGYGALPNDLRCPAQRLRLQTARRRLSLELTRFR
jgi:hypothetical protein